MRANKREMLLDTHIDCLTMAETLAEIETIIAEKRKVHHVVLNASKVNLLKRDAKLAAIINESALINADGQSIVWAGRFLGIDVPERVTGIDIFENLIELAQRKGYKVFYFGAEEETVLKVKAIHLRRYPKLQIVGHHNGFFDEAQSVKIAEKISRSQADILFVAFSSPMKEYWVNAHREQLTVPFVMGVGGSFDIVAGVTKRAPTWMRRSGLEWVYRFLQEPKRMFKRYFIGNVSFILNVLQEKWMRKGHE